MSVHIALLGRTKEPVLKGYQHYGEMSRLYILHSPNSKVFGFKDQAEMVRGNLRAVGFHEVVLVEVDAFDLQDIISKIMAIASEEKGPLYVNITGGTNLMAGAAMAASFFVGAQAYYVYGKTGSDIAQSKVIELPVPLIPYHRVVDKNQLRVLDALRALGGKADNALLRERLGISPQTMSYHVKELERKGLVTSRRYRPATGSSRVDRRALEIILTPTGRLVHTWLSSQRGRR